jgi:hypothetical protein
MVGLKMEPIKNGCLTPFFVLLKILQQFLAFGG